jgi:F0F1-type ATP synthase assembly protein I
VKDNKKLLWKYAALASQLIAGLGIAAFAGIYADKWLHTTIPLLVWILPLILLLSVLWQIIKDTGNNI